MAVRSILDIYTRTLVCLQEAIRFFKPQMLQKSLTTTYHVRCIKCGEIFDVDMDQIPDLLERIHNTHGIEFVDYDISFKGICPKCREKVKEEQHG